MLNGYAAFALLRCCEREYSVEIRCTPPFYSCLLRSLDAVEYEIGHIKVSLFCKEEYYWEPFLR